MVVTGEHHEVDLERDQRSGLVVVGDILEEVEGIEFRAAASEETWSGTSSSGTWRLRRARCAQAPPECPTRSR